jgi:NIMA (never in mitosis gene a)-related kinase 1/4/5
VLRCFGFTHTHEGHWALLLEYAENGDIKSFYDRLRAENDGQLTEEAISMSKRLELVFQMCCALKHMHDLKIYHRDLGPRNLFVSKSIRLLVGDFGATKDEESLKGNAGQTGIYTDFFADSEARTGKFAPPSDVYAFALCAYFILHGEQLYSDTNNAALY